MKLSEKKCIPCEDNSIQPLSCDEVQKIRNEYVIDIKGWEINDACTHIVLEKMFPDFLTAMQFVNSVAGIAESVGHHPDISIWYNRVQLDLWTHSIGGLSENDFIVAAKINEIK
jgi:4a-hydroxytetrahydrobiopterin dehydratase